MKPFFHRSLFFGFSMAVLLAVISIASITTINSLPGGGTGEMGRYTIAQGLILLASLLALLITVYFSLRLYADNKEKLALQEKLQQRENSLHQRIHLIQNVADKISTGEYGARFGGEIPDGDELGSLSQSLNRMAGSLEDAFVQLAQKDWLQAGLVGVNGLLLGERDQATITRELLEFIAGHTETQVGALYTITGESLLLTSSFALAESERKTEIPLGEGISGQCAQTGTSLLVNGLSKEGLSLHFAGGSVQPSGIIAVPIFYEHKVIGVIELASVHSYPERVRHFLEDISRPIGIAINSAGSRTKLQELLEETQSQSEELQAQHSELEHMNAGLEEQSQKLQASEEELKVQQEELMEANQELEERAALLEERNQMIAERNAQIQQKVEELAQSTRYKSEFLANMSHELRTPLNSILLLSRLMYENTGGNLTDEQVEFARVIQSSGLGLLTLIDEILDLSKIEAGKMELEYEDISISEIISEMKGLFNPVAMEKGLSFDVRIADEVPAVLETDKLRIGQILKNLLSNALKFTSRGSVTLEVAAVPGDLSTVSFTVADTGIGIPADKQEVIFEAFQQADGTTRRKYGGTGLGLSISRELAWLLGGAVSVQSEAGKGAAFILRLPLGRRAAVQQDKPVELAELTQPAPDPALQIPLPLRNLRTPVIPDPLPDDRNDLSGEDKIILIVEDDTHFAKSLLQFTHSRGYKGVVAVRGDHAIELAQSLKPTAILLDLRLPVKDGWEVMQELKSNPATRPIPVHIMSSTDAKKESLQKGAIDFITKPFDREQMDEIFRKIEYVLNRDSKKVLILEENPKHAQALAHYLQTFDIQSRIAGNVSEGVKLLEAHEVDCVILDMGVPDKKGYETLETVKKSGGLEHLPIIIFTGKSLSIAEELRIKQYADSIVVKTAHSYKRLMDEVSLFLHLIESDGTPARPKYGKQGQLREVLSGKTILIADDDVRNIFSLTKSLEHHDVRVFSAMDGIEALKVLQEHPQIDLVLMDMMMPEMDGYETTVQIRNNPATVNLPVIAVTAKAMTGDREKCITAGASDYITKPVDTDQLLSLLRVWLYEEPGKSRARA